MKTLVLALVAGVCCGQASAPLQMLLGHWTLRGVDGGSVEFHAGRDNKEIIGRARARTPGAQWKRIMVIYPDGSAVRADYFEPTGRTIHYKLDSFDAGMLRFVSDSGGHSRTLTYEMPGSDRLSYRFETDGRITDSGVLYASAGRLPIGRRLATCPTLLH